MLIRALRHYGLLLLTVVVVVCVVVVFPDSPLTQLAHHAMLKYPGVGDRSVFMTRGGAESKVGGASKIF